MSKDFIQALKDRRSYYGIGNKKVVSEERIEAVVKDAFIYSPSAFNSQGTRLFLLFGKEHEALWDITLETLRKIVPAQAFASTEAKINSFKAGYGTVLFYEDTRVIENLQNQFALYKDQFPIWAEQSNGMAQLAVWTALEIEGLGASLQHYNPLIDEEVAKRLNVPSHIHLVAQMPFGSIEKAPNEKTFLPLNERLFVVR